MPIPDDFHHIIQKLIDKHQPNSPEELQQLLNSLMGQPIDNFKMAPETDEEKARELIYEAYNLPKDKGKRRALKALKIYPDCIEAYEYIGDTYAYYHKAAEHYVKGVEVGRRIFGGDFLKQNKGYFYGITETRPYMRCLGKLADCFYHPGATGKALSIWKEMLELNPMDNQGIRYQLASALLEKENFTDFKNLMKEFNDDASIMFSFPKALYEFLTSGDSKKARQLLKKAHGENQHVIPLLLKIYPPEEMPQSYMMGSEEEAILYVHYGWRSWRFEAKDWLKKISYSI